MTLAEILAAVWKKARAAGVDVFYRGHIQAWEDGLQGFFHPDPHNRGRVQPQIHLYSEGRVPFPDPDDEPDRRGPHVLFDLITLAHELGHYESWRASNGQGEWREYFDGATARDAGAELTDRQRTLIMAEEERAWTSAERTLRAFPDFTEWPAFETRRREGLDAHRERLDVAREGEE